MTGSRIPEGRKPLTDADIAALTRRLAGTAVDYKELYEAAKRDAEEAEAYAAELEGDRRKTYEALLLVSRLHSEVEAKVAEQIEWVKRLADDLIAAEGREARLNHKLAKVIDAADAMAAAIEEQIDIYDASEDEVVALHNYRTTLAEMKGHKR